MPWAWARTARFATSTGARRCGASTTCAAPAERHDISSFDPRQMIENEEYPGWGGTRYYEPALKVTRPDGDRDLVLQYASHRIHDNDLDIVLKDIRDPIEVTLHYRVYPEYGILRRSATIRNGTANPLTLESAQSAAWYLPPGDGYQLTYLSGRWAAEMQINHEPIHEGEKVLESRKGHTSHNFNPWFAIDAGDAAEESRPRLVRRARLERQLAHHRGADALSPGARHRRLQHFRFLLPARSPARRSKRRSSIAGFSQSRLRRRLACRCIASSASRFCPAAPSRACARCSTTPGKPPPSTSTSPARSRWRTKPRSSASSCSSWTTAGSASATTTMPAWAIGWSIRTNFPTA